MRSDIEKKEEDGDRICCDSSVHRKYSSNNSKQTMIVLHARSANVSQMPWNNLTAGLTPLLLARSKLHALAAAFSARSSPIKASCSRIPSTRCRFTPGAPTISPLPYASCPLAPAAAPFAACAEPFCVFVFR